MLRRLSLIFAISISWFAVPLALDMAAENGAPGVDRIRTPSSRSGEAQVGSTPRSRFVTTADGLRIHYLETGPTDQTSTRPAILFVPGWTMPADIFEQQLSWFSKTRRVVAMDPRSYGLSSQTSEDNTPEGHARDIRAVIEQLRLSPVVLVGWSLGVEAVAAYIDQFGSQGVAGLVLVDELLVFDRDAAFMKVYMDFSWGLQANRPGFVARFVREMCKTPQSDAYYQRITRDCLRTPGNTAVALIDSWIARDRAPLLQKIDKPTLIISAVRDEDYLKTQQAMQKLIPGSQLEMFDNVGHALFVDDAKRFNARVDHFSRRPSANRACKPIASRAWATPLSVRKCLKDHVLQRTGECGDGGRIQPRL